MRGRKPERGRRAELELLKQSISVIKAARGIEMLLNLQVLLKEPGD